MQYKKSALIGGVLVAGIILALMFGGEPAPTGRLINAAGQEVSCGTYETLVPAGATASSTHSEQTAYALVSYPASYATDGSSATYWRGSSQTSYPQWIYFSLQGEHCVREISVVIPSGALPVTANIEVSDDASSWNTLASDWTISSPGENVLALQETTARYIRVYESAGYISSGALAHVRVSAAPLLVVGGSCSDSDAGLAYTSVGTVSTASSESTDRCTSNQELTEYYCENGQQTSLTYRCPCRCADGACQERNGGSCADDTNDETEEQEQGGGGGGSRLSAELTSRVTSALGRQGRVSFSLEGEMHSVSVVGITPSSVELLIQSMPQRATMHAGEERSFDVTGDREDDIRVIVSGISALSESATIVVEKIGSEAAREECIIYPSLCPMEGAQNKICIDPLRPNAPSTTTALSCVAGSCSGCMYQERCLPYGTRIRDYAGDGKKKYCGNDGALHEQLDRVLLSPDGTILGGACSADFECASDVCSEGVCVEAREILANAPPASATTVRALCRSANFLDQTDYEECLLEYLKPYEG